jgi:putative oxidoreductase
MNSLFDTVKPYADVIGLYTRPVALLLAGFSIIAALLFHAGSADQLQQLMFLKDLGLAGGFLFLVANGAGRLSVDARLLSLSKNRSS